MRGDDPHDPTYGDPERANACHAAMDSRLAAEIRFVCLSFGETLRTAGNEGVPLQ
jgi:hypothetical protein